MTKLFSFFFIFLAIFLFGMTIMRLGLYNLSGEKFKKHLHTLTDSPMKGLLVGACVTAVLQSSSAVLVLTIGLVAASYITFRQSIGIILGANIGTTMTAELITISIDDYIVPMLLIGFLLMVQRNSKLFCTGSIIFGLACIFVAMEGFESLAQPLASIYFINQLLESSNAANHIGLLIGTVLTAAIQSSSATTGIAMSFINENLLTLQGASAIILGANIGTCITGIIACIGTSTEAKLTAFAHMWLNIFGVVLCLPFLKGLTYLAEKLTQQPDLQLAHVSLFFNIFTAIAVLLLLKPFTFFVLKVHGKEH